MAKSSVNRSQAVRDYLKGNPKASAKEAIGALAAQGIKVQAGLFYLIKSNLKRKKRKETRQKVATVAGTTSQADALHIIMKVKSLAGDAGGMKKLKALVDAMAE